MRFGTTRISSENRVVEATRCADYMSCPPCHPGLTGRVSDFLVKGKSGEVMPSIVRELKRLRSGPQASAAARGRARGAHAGAARAGAEARRQRAAASAAAAVGGRARSLAML